MPGALAGIERTSTIITPLQRCASGYALGYSGIDDKRPIRVAQERRRIENRKNDNSCISRHGRVAEVWSGATNAAALETSRVSWRAWLALVLRVMRRMSGMLLMPAMIYMLDMGRGGLLMVGVAWL